MVYCTPNHINHLILSVFFGGRWGRLIFSENPKRFGSNHIRSLNLTLSRAWRYVSIATHNHFVNKDRGLSYSAVDKHCRKMRKETEYTLKVCVLFCYCLTPVVSYDMT